MPHLIPIKIYEVGPIKPFNGPGMKACSISGQSQGREDLERGEVQGAPPESRCLAGMLSLGTQADCSIPRLAHPPPGKEGLEV